MPERPQLAVVDSTPIIALALVGRLDLLRRLYGQVAIPPAVQREVLAGGPGAAGSAELQRATWIRVIPLQDPRRAEMLSDLTLCCHNPRRYYRPAHPPHTRPAGRVEYRMTDLEQAVQGVESGLLPAIHIAGRSQERALLCERMARRNVPGFSVALIEGGEIAWAGGYGMAAARSLDSL